MADWSESWSRRVWQDGELIEEHTGSTSGRVSTQDDGAIDLTLPAPSFQDLTHLLGPGLSTGQKLVG
ncbi:hypothetical protein [Leptolyngbya sp. 7M]|uniref:hypothetical protein n=1 Tax=Leptolyngbya sp. 7M TaxID=2812896 RepID=UPI001B8C41FD|nr:hypothetical protein [Leptolyngbya sp. 7M]QYO62565.1 hypothetical protein JVX88_21195 [Leptolyngbya sp. 7M]